MFKKNDPKICSNYRPVSILSVISKLVESLVKIRLQDFLIKHNILSSNQFGFQPNISTSDALIKVTDFILSSLDKREAVCGLFCDLQRAFDCVDHAILQEKLELCGVRGLALEWFSSYLSDRGQVVEIESVQSGQIKKFQSSKLILQAGVPQGSVLVLYCF